MGFFVAVFLLAIPAFIFSILAWRLRTAAMFWLGVVSSGAILVLYFYEIEFLISCFSSIDSMTTGVFFLALFGIPLFFLINSKMAKSSTNEDITDDYLNSIINEKDEEIDFE
jgi:hypothetical protein